MEYFLIILWIYVDEIARTIPKFHKNLDKIANFWMNAYKFAWKLV